MRIKVVHSQACSNLCAKNKATPNQGVSGIVDRLLRHPALNIIILTN